MRPVLELHGRAASDGLFAGPLHCIDRKTVARRHSGSVEEECSTLKAAIAAGLADLSGLMAKAAGEAADLLAFQLAVLEDNALSDPAYASISLTLSAEDAWRSALDREIAGYEMSREDSFRARAADFRDIRDRVLRHLSGSVDLPHFSGGVLCGEDMGPSLFLETDWSRGGAIALNAGSPASHVAILARARGVPMVVGLRNGDFAAHSDVIVDGGSGIVIFDPGPGIRRRYVERHATHASAQSRDAGFLLREARRKDGSRIEVLINVAGVADLDRIDPRCCDGIGLMRSEFLFRDGAPWPDEEQQYQAYCRFLAWAEGRPVTIRTLDVGGDKPLRGLTREGEKNPFLGLRGVRLTLARPDIFRTQLRALARAAMHGPLNVMIPMVTVPRELAGSAALLAECIDDLRRAHIPCATPPLGIMIEVPAAAIAPELFTDAAFFSIGSNDLTQYVTATARDESALTDLQDPAHPAVSRLIASVVAFGRSHDIPVSLCGDMAGDPAHLASLLRAGLTALSVAPARVGRVKATLAEL